MTPESLVNRLHDIHELDAVSAWPLATGWWLLIGAFSGLLLLGLLLRRWRPNLRRYLPKRGWSRHAADELARLRIRVKRDDARVLASELSELIRRIAIARCGRRHCAGLQGEDWLAYLAEHDPDGFDWREHGRPLLALPYAPPGAAADTNSLYALIDAAQTWTSLPRSCRRSAEA